MRMVEDEVGLVMVALTPPAESATGVALKLTTLALLMSGVLLGEGFICILMAAPLFYAIALTIGVVVDLANQRSPFHVGSRSYKSNPRNLIAVLPALLLMLEGQVPGFSLPRDDEATVSILVDATPEQVEATLSRQPKIPEMHLPVYLSLGFPRPVAFEQTGTAEGDECVIHWDAGGQQPTFQRYRVAHRSDRSLRMVLLEDSSPIAHWLTWYEVEITWEDAGEGRTRVSWTNRWRRELDPGWYFGPAERMAMRQAARVQLAIVTVP